MWPHGHSTQVTLGCPTWESGDLPYRLLETGGYSAELLVHVVLFLPGEAGCFRQVAASCSDIIDRPTGSSGTHTPAHTHTHTHKHAYRTQDTLDTLRAGTDTHM